MAKKSFIFFLLLIGCVFSQNYVIVRGETLFTAVDSNVANSATAFLDSLLASGEFREDSIFIERYDSLWGIGYGDCTFVWLHIPDTISGAGTVTDICQRLEKFSRETDTEPPLGLSGLFRLLIALMAPIVFVIIVLVLAKIARKIIRHLIYQEGRLIRGVKFGKFTLLPAKEELRVFINVIRWTRNVIVLVLFYGMLLFIFYLYPATRSFANRTFTLTLQALRDAGIAALNVIGFALGALVLYAVARIFMKSIDIIFRHYEQSEKLRIPSESLGPLRNLAKTITALIFILVFIAIIPGPGDIAAIIGLFLIIAIAGFSAIPLIRNYITGYNLIFRNILKPKDRVHYSDRWWEIESINPMHITLKSLSRNEKVIITVDDLISGGIIFEPYHTTSEPERTSEHSNSTTAETERIDS